MVIEKRQEQDCCCDDRKCVTPEKVTGISIFDALEMMFNGKALLDDIKKNKRKLYDV